MLDETQKAPGSHRSCTNEWQENGRLTPTLWKVPPSPAPWSLLRGRDGGERQRRGRGETGERQRGDGGDIEG